MATAGFPRLLFLFRKSSYSVFSLSEMNSGRRHFRAESRFAVSDFFYIPYKVILRCVFLNGVISNMPKHLKFSVKYSKIYVENYPEEI